jgi:hypothetical protein
MSNIKKCQNGSIYKFDPVVFVSKASDLTSRNARMDLYFLNLIPGFL